MERLNKISKAKIPSLKRKLWKLFSVWVKKRDKGICMACGRRASGKNYHAGHIIPKSICGVVLAFHPLNVWGTCYNCNIWASGNSAILAQRVSEKLGYNIIQHLERIRKDTKNQQWDADILKSFIDHLKIFEKSPTYQGHYLDIYESLYRLKDL